MLPRPARRISFGYFTRILSHHVMIKENISSTYIYRSKKIANEKVNFQFPSPKAVLFPKVSTIISRPALASRISPKSARYDGVVVQFKLEEKEGITKVQIGTARWPG